MPQSHYERVVARAFLYLSVNGCPINADTTRLVMQTVQEELAHDDEQLLSRILHRLETRLPAKSRPVSALTPPLKRSSIGYPK